MQKATVMRSSSLKAQDLIVALKLTIVPSLAFTYAEVSAELGLPASGVHASVQMLIHARLATGSSRDSVQVNRSALQELLIYGVPYFFPATIGGPSRGMPTGSALLQLGSPLITRDEGYVWPSTHGTARGTSLQPLHPCALIASENDSTLYRILTCIDVLRVEGARERALAIKLLRQDLA